MFKDGKEETRFSNYCVTQHELIDGNVGRAIMSAAVRQMDGEPTQYLMVMMPLNVNLKAGMRGALYPKDLWEPAQRNEKIDESKLKGIGLEYNICHKGGCTAQVEVTPQLLNDLKTFGGIAVFAVSDRGEAVSFPVPLAGFAQAYASAGIELQTVRGRAPGPGATARPAPARAGRPAEETGPAATRGSRPWLAAGRQEIDALHPEHGALRAGFARID